MIIFDELLTLDLKIVLPDDVVESVKTAENLGKTQSRKWLRRFSKHDNCDLDHKIKKNHLQVARNNSTRLDSMWCLDCQAMTRSGKSFQLDLCELDLYYYSGEI